MKKTLLFLTYLFCSFHLFAQSTIFEWEQLPSPSRNGVEVFYQTQQGYLISKLSLQTVKYILSKDDGKTWIDIKFPTANLAGTYLFFKEDEANNLYVEYNDTVYKYNYSNNSFSTFFKASNTIIGDFGIKGDKIYIANDKQLLVFSKTTAQIISTHNWNGTFGYTNITIGEKDKNYVNYSNGGSQELLYRFNDDGTVSSTVALPTLLYLYGKIGIGKSGKLLLKDHNNLWISGDNGTNWTKLYCEIPLPNTSIVYNKMEINATGEIYVTYNDDVLSYSNDNGTSWEKIKYPMTSVNFRNFNIWNKKANQITLAPYSNCDDDQIFVSEDKGKTWKAYVSEQNPPASNELLITKDESILNSDCTGFNDFITKNKTDWQNINENNKYHFFNIIVFPSGKWLAADYSSAYSYRYFESFNQGLSWTPYTKSPVLTFDWEKTIVQNQNKELVIFEENLYYISKDEGFSWVKVDAPNLGKIALGNFYSKILMRNGFIYFQDDKDYSTINYYDSKNKVVKSMKLFNSPQSFSRLQYLDFLDNNRLCIIATRKSNTGTGEEIITSITSDFGKTLMTKTVEINKWNILFNFVVDENKNFIYAAGNKLAISYDEGENWQPISGLPQNINLSSMALSQNQYLYVGLENGKIYKAKYPLGKTAKITGSIFVDINKNCIKDSGEPYFKNIKVKAENGQDNLMLSNKNGSFRFNVFKGIYNISTLANDNVYLPCQPNYTIKIDSTKDSVHLNIPLKIKKYCADLSVSLGSVLPLRRCFSNTYYGKVCNEGSKEAKNTKITIQLDSLFDFESASLPVVSLVNQTLILDAGTVDYGDCKDFNIKFTVSCKSALGKEHCISLAVSSPDACDNEQPGAQAKPYLECKKNVGSYDPNDKTAFVDGRQSTTQVKAGQKIEYLVRFQNTGTDTAFNIVVKDPIHANLDVSSIAMGASSHAYTWEVRENVLSVTFKNIMLPDSNVNKKTSHGFFKFLIQPKSNVTSKDLVTNTAAIYFDFNEPIFTNEAILNKKTSKTSEIQREIDFLLYPNPATEQITLELPQRLEGESNALLYSIDGRLLTKKTIVQNNSTFDVQDLPKGIYFIHVKNKTQFGVKKFVKE